MSFPRYPKYKDSGVEWLGQVPEQWAVNRLKHCARLVTAKAEERTNPVALENIEGWTGRLLPSEGDYQGEGTAFAAGDILFGKLRPYLAKVHLATQSGEAVGDFHVLRPDKGFDGHFAQYHMLTREFIGIVDGSTYGSKMPRASWEFVGGMPMAVPPPDEQPAIAAFLDRETAKIDALIAEQQRLIELLQEKRQAVISHAVTKGLTPDAPMKDSGIEWLGEVPEHWEVGPLKRFWATTDCKHITAEFVEEGYPLASIREVQNRWVDLSSAKQTTEHFYLQLIEGGRKPMEGDLIFSRNATVGEVAQVPVNPPAFAMGQDVCLLRRHHAGYSAEYLHAVLRSPVVIEQLAQLMIGSTFKRINVEEIRGLMVPMPPADEQVGIAAVIAGAASQTDYLAVEAERTVSLLQERRSALISAAVTGQIDVRGLAGSEAA